MLRQSTAERIKILLTLAGAPVTGLVAADFKGSNAFLYKSDGSKTTIALTLGGNLFEEDATDEPGIYTLNLTTTHTNTLGSISVSFQPAAAAFTQTYFTETVEVDNTANITAIKAKTDNLPASPANEVTVAAIKAKTDNLPTTPADQATSLLIKAKTDLIPASPASETTSTAIKAKTDLIGTSSVASQTDVTNARDSVKGAQLLSISDLGGGAMFTTGDDLHSIRAAISALGLGLAGQVWEELLSGHTTTNTFGEFLNLLLAIYTNRVRVDRATKRMIIYAADSITPIKYYNLYDINGVSADINAAERGKIV